MTDRADAPPAQRSIGSVQVAVSVFSSTRQSRADLVTIEEPLEIRLGFVREGVDEEQSFAVTMRTPGDDFDLVRGFLFAEGIIDSLAHIDEVAYDEPPTLDKGLQNVVRVRLSAACRFDPASLMRNVLTSSSCGVCGKTSLEAVQPVLPLAETSNFRITADHLKQLPSRLRESQSEFDKTGGLHACGAFSSTGEIARLREDVGRHNAMDKLIGSYVYGDVGEMSQLGIVVSGRASFELVQKAAMARVPIVAAIGPPSSLAVELAEEQNMTLIGFLSSSRFNQYCGSAISLD